MSSTSAPSDSTMDAMYATWTADPTLAPWTSDIRLPVGALFGNYITALLLTSALVGVRLHVRYHIVKRVGYDDWTLVAAQLSYLVYILFLATLATRIAVYGIATQYWPTMLALSFEPLPLGVLSILVRLSVATFFLRALPLFTETVPRLVIITLVSLYTCFMIAHTFVNIFQCGNPLASDAEAAVAVCVPTTVLYAMIRAARILNVVMDWSMTLVPVILVARSSLDMADRLSAIGILVLAGMGSTVSILGVVYVRMGDIWWPSDVPHSFLFTLLSVWENGMVLVVLSLATLRPLARKWSSSKSADPEMELAIVEEPANWVTVRETVEKDSAYSLTMRTDSEASDPPTGQIKIMLDCA